MVKEYNGIQISGVLCDEEKTYKESAADIAVRIAESILDKHNIRREDIKVMIYVTQSPLFMTPSTSFYIAKKLNLEKDCYQYDINQGATGMIVGTQLIASLMISFEKAEKGLLLLADDGLECEMGKKGMASAVLFEKNKKGRILVKNCSDGLAYMKCYQGLNDIETAVSDDFYSYGKMMLEKQMLEMEKISSKTDILLENKVECEIADSAVRLPLILAKEQVHGTSLLGAWGGGMSAAAMICDLSENIYKK